MGDGLYIDFVITGPCFSKAAQLVEYYFAAIILQIKQHCTAFSVEANCDLLNFEYTLASPCTPPLPSLKYKRSPRGQAETISNSLAGANPDAL